jgi:hypothetical protein
MQPVEGEGSQSVAMRLLANARSGASIGATFGTVYALWALVLYLIGGKAFANGDFTLLGVCAFYLAGGVIAGGVVGLMRPLLRQPASATLVGIAACLPLAIGFRVLYKGLTVWTRTDTLFVMIWPVVFGVPASLVLWNIFAPPPEDVIPE